MTQDWCGLSVSPSRETRGLGRSFEVLVAWDFGIVGSTSEKVVKSRLAQPGSAV